MTARLLAALFAALALFVCLPGASGSPGPAPARAAAPQPNSIPGDWVPFYAGTQVAGTKVLPPAGFGAARTGIRTQGATINVTYHGFTPQAQAAFQAAVDIWSQVITSPVPVTIDATWEALDPGFLGFAKTSSYWQNFVPALGESVMIDTYYTKALANKLHGSDVDSGQPDIQAKFSSGANWYLGTDGVVPAGQYDFETAVLHEIGHGLGFVGGFSYNAAVNPPEATWTPDWSTRPTVMGRHVVYTATGGSSTLIGAYPNINDQTQRQGIAVMLTSGSLYFNGTNAVNAQGGGNNPRLWTPPTYVQGTSGYHLDENAYPQGDANSLMTPILQLAEAVHYPGQITIGLLRDIGWTAGNIPTNSPQVNGVLSVTSTSVHLLWTDNSNNELGFGVLRMSNGGPWTKVADLPPGAQDYTDNGLTSGAYYAYWVYAYPDLNDLDPGARAYASTYVTVIPSSTVPRRPFPVATYGVGTSLMWLQWADNSDNELGFRVLHWDGANWVQQGTDRPANSTSHGFSGYAASTPQYYWITAFNAEGTSYAPAYIAGDTWPNGTSATAPAYNTATGVSAFGATVNWMDRSSNEAGFGILRMGGSAGATWTKVGFTAANATTFADTFAQPDPGAYYAYWVYATTDATDTDPNARTYAPTYMTVVTPPAAPIPPMPLAAMGTSNSSIFLYWEDRSNDEAGFRVRRWNGSGWPQVGSDLPANTTTFTDTALQPFSPYYYWISAVNAHGESYADRWIAANTYP